MENLRTLEQTISDNVADSRIITILSASFASLATLLAAVGLYGVLSYAVAQRTREFEFGWLWVLMLQESEGWFCDRCCP